MTDQIRFDDGAGYERYMGVWSRLAGDQFLDWLAPPHGLQWLDVGCGNGAFTETLIARCAPASVDGIDPSAEQLAFARTRPPLAGAQLQEGDAMRLPFPADHFDVAVMPLVIFFVPEPSVGVAEMVRVVRPGGLVTAYAWDMEGRGFPYALLQAELRALDLPVPSPPHPEASRLDVLQSLWTDAGLVDVELHTITVARTFADFDDYWTTVGFAPSAAGAFGAAGPEQVRVLQDRLRAQLPVDAAGRITYTSRAHAVRGRVVTR